MRVVSVGLLMLIAAAIAACGGGGPNATNKPPSAATPAPGVTTIPVATAGSGELPTAEELCGLLSTADWAQAGLANAKSPAIDTDGPGSAYCSFTSASGAEGGLEFDSFVDATAADAEGTFETMTGEGPAMSPTELPGADAALISTGGDYATIAVRAGRLTFAISVPSSDQAEIQLKALAALALSRSIAYR